MPEVNVNDPGSCVFLHPGEWTPTKGVTIDLLITEDEEGIYSAVAVNLPGAGSCGDTKEEAEENAKEAIRGVLESYLDARTAIPWKDTTNFIPPFGAELKRIVVHG